MDFRAVIMAGGIGSRFWPLSRENRPKQFLPIVSEQSMIEETFNRLLPKIPSSNIYTIANPAHSKKIKNLLPSLPETNLLVEPQGKNTAPSLMLATAAVYIQNPKAVVAALPADHLIKDTSQFLKKLEAGASAAIREQCLITFGIPPTFPSTGFGYIQFSKENSFPILGENFYSVQNFKEKPNHDQALFFLEAGNYFWNSGMFLWQAEVFQNKLKCYAPDMFYFWEKMIEALRNKDETQITSIFKEIPSISIDYALMEKTDGVLMCKGNFQWSDVGTWSALSDVWEKDNNGNAVRGKSIILDSKNCLIYNPKKLTAVVGIENIIIVDTEDALLICRKDEDQKVKIIVERIKENK